MPEYTKDEALWFAICQMRRAAKALDIAGMMLPGDWQIYVKGLNQCADECEKTLEPSVVRKFFRETFPNEAEKEIFVFGSNTAGVHGAGAALDAKLHHGAIQGQGHGRQGDSYAIATRTTKPGHPYIVDFESFDDVKKNVADFVQYAQDNIGLDFKITQIGCGHAGYKPEQMAPLFADCPKENCKFDTAWQSWLGDDRKYWGHV